MRVRAKLPQLHLRSTRAAMVAMFGVLAGATGVAGMAHQLTLAGQPRPVPAGAAPTESEFTPSMRAVIPAGRRDVDGAASAVEDDVGREPVGPPSDYPGSIVKAPDAAIAAYQRAEAVINQAADCGLDWTVLAAIARVESNHGQGPAGDHTVTRKGRVKPAYVGAPLNGKSGRGELADTDLGELDGNRSWDAPVGALGLLPTRWSSVAVDADGNDRRDPQDLDDAALGASVFLCAEITSGREASDADATPEPTRPARPAEPGGFEAQTTDDLRTSTTERAEKSEKAKKPAEPEESEATRPEKAEKSEKSEKQLLRAALRQYHDGKRFVSTVLALRKRYEKQAEKLPAYEPPPGGVDVPDLPPLCDCDPPRSARDENNDSDDDGGKRSPGGKKDGPVSPSPDGKGPQPGGGGGSGTPGTPSPSDPSPTDPGTSPTDPTTGPTDPTTGPTDPSTTPTDDPPTSDDPTPSKTTSDPPTSSSVTTDPSITP